MSTGYSGTPLVKKLGIKEGMAVRVVNPPGDLAKLLEAMPDGVNLAEAGSISAISEPVDIVLFFTNFRDELFDGLARVQSMIVQNGAVWVSWYKKASKLPSEITEDLIREAALPIGLVDIKVCAVDDKWSGLKLVIRKENRI